MNNQKERVAENGSSLFVFMIITICAFGIFSVYRLTFCLKYAIIKWEILCKRNNNLNVIIVL